MTVGPDFGDGYSTGPFRVGFVLSLGAWDSEGMTKLVNCGNAESPRRSEVAVAEEELSAIAEVWRSQENWDAIRFSHYMSAEDAYQAEGYRAEPKHRNSWSEVSQSPHLPHEFVDGAFQGKARKPVAGLERHRCQRPAVFYYNRKRTKLERRTRMSLLLSPLLSVEWRTSRNRAVTPLSL